MSQTRISYVPLPTLKKPRLKTFFIIAVILIRALFHFKNLNHLRPLKNRLFISFKLIVLLLLTGKNCVAQQRTNIHPTKRYAVFYEALPKGFPLIPNGVVIDSTHIKGYADSTAAWIKQYPNIKGLARNQQRDSVMLNYDQIRQISSREKAGERTLFHGARQGLKVQRAFRASQGAGGKQKVVQSEEAVDVYLLNSSDFHRLKAEFK
jgi:hypothetical protein